MKTPTPVQKVVAEIKFDEQKSAFMKKSPIQPSFRHEMKPMTFEQQSQTELSMYDPSLSDLHLTSSTRKAALKKEIQME